MTRQWSTAAPLPEGLGHIGPDTYSDGRHIIIAVGQTNAATEDLITDVFRYEPATNAWTRLTSIPQPRKSSAVGIINRKVVVANSNSYTSPYISNTTRVGG